MVGRSSGQAQLNVVPHSTREQLEPRVLAASGDGATVNTDEWGAYDHLHEQGRLHATVCHAPGKREWARDDDGDGIREVHNNTMEGLWTGLRNFLRRFRGMHKKYRFSANFGDYWGWGVPKLWSTRARKWWKLRMPKARQSRARRPWLNPSVGPLVERLMK